MNRKFGFSLVTIVLVFLVSFFVFDSIYGSTKPSVDTSKVHIDSTRATLTGIIKDSGGKSISQYGFRWGTNRNLENTKTLGDNINAGKEFSTTISGLKAGNTYYYQAYAINSKGITYGKIASFKIPANKNAAPVVSITNPRDRLTVTKGDTVNITAIATDDNKIKNMHLFVNGLSKLTVKSSSLNYRLDTSNLTPGNYVIKVAAWDGTKLGSKTMAFTVQNSTQTDVAAATEKQTEIKVAYAGSRPVSRGAIPTNSYKYPKLSKVNGSFGQFRYRDISGGRIEVDPNWIAQNIVTITLPGLNRQVQVHRKAANSFIKAFTYIKNGTANINGRQVSLLSLVKTMDGTWVTRHANWNPAQGLSNHSWGSAIDINASNHYRYVNPGSEPYDPNLILWEKAFKPAGFSWGNSYGDAMHFELLW
ncbi:MAG: Ig-like domain-containing protein [Syntrophomonadaceae bacterium]|jgi:hypothetical protein